MHTIMLGVIGEERNPSLAGVEPSPPRERQPYHQLRVLAHSCYQLFLIERSISLYISGIPTRSLL